MAKTDKYLNFIEVGNKTKTKIISVQNNSSIELAIIKWNAPWRKYCIFFNSETIFDAKCLEEITTFLNQINKDHKDGGTKRK